MNEQAMMIWFRHILKQIIKPEFFIMVSDNLSDIEWNEENKHKMGLVLEGILRLMDGATAGTPNGHMVDAILKEYLPSLLRKSSKTNLI